LKSVDNFVVSDWNTAPITPYSRASNGLTNLDESWASDSLSDD